MTDSTIPFTYDSSDEDERSVSTPAPELYLRRAEVIDLSSEEGSSSEDEGSVSPPAPAPGIFLRRTETVDRSLSSLIKNCTGYSGDSENVDRYLNFLESMSPDHKFSLLITSLVDSILSTDGDPRTKERFLEHLSSIYKHCSRKRGRKVRTPTSIPHFERVAESKLDSDIESSPLLSDPERAFGPGWASPFTEEEEESGKGKEKEDS